MEGQEVPTGEKILKLLLDLYAEQEGLVIDYKIMVMKEERGL